ncbi:MAG: Ppx/GppA phosphatase family protein [Sulfuricurvum sp.]
MAQCTAVIDIGSNSMRMAVFQKTSRFAFHIIHEAKSSVRLGENAYSNGGRLQSEPINRTANALGEFLSIARSFGARKILCVATSALRDAPNASDFISRIRQEHHLAVKIIDGEKEAYLGGLACANLLPKIDAVTVDVGGGSTEFARLIDGRVSTLVSLNIGTVRIKELFLDRNDLSGAIRYIDQALTQLPPMDVASLIGIGGTYRALTRAMMKKEEYPLKKLHGYTTDIERFNSFCTQILDASVKKLKSLNIKPDRFDTIKPGTLILQRVVKYLKIRQLTCSGVGVREGVYLNDLLRNSKGCFPANYNPSVRYLLDTFATHSNHGNECARLSKRIFDLLSIPMGLSPSYRSELSIASKLLAIGIGIRYYAYQRHSHYLATSTLDYGLSHSQIALIAQLLLFKKGRSASSLIPKGKIWTLLPEEPILDLLSNILWIAHILLAQRASSDTLELEYSNNTLIVRGKHLYMAREQLKNIVTVPNLKIDLQSY